MARATAHLEVTVNDKQLVDHASTLSKTRETWDSLVKAAKDFSGAYTQDMGKGFADLGKGLAAFNKIDATKVKEVFQALKETAKTDMSKFIKHLEGFDQKFIPLVKNTKAWGDQLARVFGYIKALEDRLDTLGVQQQKTVQLSNKFEGELKQITDAMKAQADTMKGLVQSYAGLNTSLQKNNETQTKTTEKVEKQVSAWERFKKGVKEFERDYIRHATAMYIADQWIKAAIEGFREAAQEIDLSRVLARSVEGWGKLREETSKTLRGTVSDLQILKSAALLSSFGIPIDNLAKNMDLMSKMAIRTGQDMTYIMDSFARGVSRLSPAILDNLGLQIKLSDAYATHAATLGIGVDQLDAYAKKQAVLNEVLRQSEKLTKDIDPYASMQARLDKAQAGFTNLWNAAKGTILQFFFAIDQDQNESLANTKDLMEIRIKELKQYGRVVTEEAKSVSIAQDLSFQNDLDRKAKVFDKWRRMVSLGLLSDEYYRDVMFKMTDKYLVELKDLTGSTIEETIRLHEIQLNRIKQAQEEEQRYHNLLKIRKDLIDELLVRQPGGPGGVILAGSEERIAEIEKNISRIERAKDVFEMIYKDILAIHDVKPTGDTLIDSVAQVVNEKSKQRLLAMYNSFKALAELDASGAARVAYALKDMMGAEQVWTLAQRNADLVKQQVEEFKRKNLEGFKELETANKLYAQSLLLADLDKTKLSMAVEFEKKQKEFADAQATFIDMEQKALLNKTQDAEFTSEQVLTQAQKVKGLAEEVAKLQERAALDERVNGLLKDQSFWTDQMKRDEAARLSGGKTREQIQMRMVVLQKELNDDLRKQRDIELGIVDSTADQLKNRISLWNFAATFLNKFVTGPAAVEQRKKELDDLSKALGLMGSGGGGGDKDKKSETLDRFLKDGLKWLKKHYDERKALEKAGEEATNARLAREEELAKRKEELSKIEIEILNNRRDLYIQTELFKSDATDAKGTLADNIKLLETLRTYQEKYKDVMTFEEAMYIRGFITGIQDSNKVLMEHIRLWDQVIQSLRDYGTAADWAMKYAKGIISDTEIKVIGDLTANLGGLASTMEKALGGTADSYDLMGAGLNVIRGFTGEYIKDMKQRAKVEMLMNGAMSFAAMAMGNVPKAISHATAATMFGLVAGGAIRLPGQASGQDQKQSTQAGPLHIHLYSEMAMTDAERGYLIDRAVQQAAAEGRV